MEQNAYFMEAITGLVCLVLGLRLFLRSRQSGQLPERFLSHTLLIWAGGYALYDVPYALVGLDELIPPFFSYTSLLAFGLGNVAFAVFVKEVFRKREGWAGWFVVVVALCALAGATGSAWVGDWEQVDPFENFGYWPQSLCSVIPSFWLAAESVSVWFNARRRSALDLVDPLANHRILLLGLVGAQWVLLEIVIATQDFVFIHEGNWSFALGIANGVLEMAPIAMLWLAFFPPAAYRRWLEAKAAA